MSFPEVEFIRQHPYAVIPFKAHEADSGLDLFSVEEVTLNPMERRLVDTGLLVNVGYGWEGQVRPRSGNASKLGLTVLNSPGTVDGTYDGRLKVILINLGQEPVFIKVGDKIAQFVIQKVETKIEVRVVTEFSRKNDRGSRGFGSTGVVGG